MGTEDRCPMNPVPAREEVFEYIVFRGKDIKDLHVSEGPKKVDDPAIVHVSYNSNNFATVRISVSSPGKQLIRM